MRIVQPSLFSLVVLSGLIVISSCSKKDDPVPLGAQKNAILLAGEAGKSKGWKLTQLTRQYNAEAPVTRTLDACFTDNVYTFSNNSSQDYVATEGLTPCPGGFSPNMEYGTWAFTIDGLIVTIVVDETYSPYGLFSSEINGDSDGNVFNIGYPYPAAVKTLTATSMVLELNEVLLSNKYKYTMTFVPA